LVAILTWTRNRYGLLLTADQLESEKDTTATKLAQLKTQAKLLLEHRYKGAPQKELLDGMLALLETGGD
jgi:hypothetical protein